MGRGRTSFTKTKIAKEVGTRRKQGVKCIPSGDREKQRERKKREEERETQEREGGKE
jgi:hypothetical protein